MVSLKTYQNSANSIKIGLMVASTTETGNMEDCTVQGDWSFLTGTKEKGSGGMGGGSCGQGPSSKKANQRVKRTVLKKSTPSRKKRSAPFAESLSGTGKVLESLPAGINFIIFVLRSA